MSRRTSTTLGVAAAVLAAALFGLTWRNMSTRDDSALETRGRAVTSTSVAPRAAPPTPSTTAPVVIGPTREAEPGRTLRLGYARPPSSPAVVADAIVPTVGLYSAPGDPEPAETLDNPTWEGLPGVYLVQQEYGDWLEVQIPMRPNESTAWIKKADVSIRQTQFRIVVNITERRLIAYDGAQPFLDTTVAVGAGSGPTPTGNFFVDGTVKVPYDDGPYGAYQMSVAAFSDVYYSFGSGIGQIALHGTNDPALLGTPASHGCVRMTNEAITQLANTAPPGTPVQIIA
jgi:lipoprotein-anchoring transpeptidase ErfK/SrfK